MTGQRHQPPEAPPDTLHAAAWTVAQSPARLTIDVIRAPEAARIAPEAVWFEAVPEGFTTDPRPERAVAYLPEFHEIEYLWDFGEPGDRFEAPQNVPDAFRDANTTTGQIAAHVFRTGGKKRVRCTARRVIDAETMEIEEAVAEVMLDIGDPEALWTDANTVVVALDGDFTGAPAGARATSVSDTEETPWWSDPQHWLTQVNRLIGEGERGIRILFKRGAAYPTWLFKPNRRAPHIAKFVLFGAWGDPQLHKPTFPRLGHARAGWANGQPVVFQGVQAVHDYDPVTERGSQETLMHHNEVGYALFTDVTFARAGIGIIVQNSIFAQSAEPTRACFHDCTFEFLASYGIYAEDRPGDRFAYLGCRDIDNGAAPHGGDGDFSSGNSQGPIRTMTFGDWIIAHSDFFSRNGWSGQGKWPGTDIAASAEQPSMRLFVSGAQEPEGNGRAVVTRCAAEGGPLVAVSPRASLPLPRGNLVVDQVMHVASASSYTFLVSHAGAITIRNGLWIKPEVPGAFRIYSAFQFEHPDKPPELSAGRAAEAAEPIRIYNNTFILMQTEASRSGHFARLDDFENFDEANNVFYMPNLADDPRHEDIAPFDDTKLFDLRWLGRLEYGDKGVLQRHFAAPEGSANLYRPERSSPVVGSVAGLISVVDMLGNPRSGTLSRGALEPE